MNTFDDVKQEALTDDYLFQSLKEEEREAAETQKNEWTKRHTNEY